MQKKVIIPLVIVLLIGAVAVIRSRKNSDEVGTPERVAGVSIQAIETQNEVKIPVKITGQIKGKQSTTIRSLVDGTVQSLLPVGAQVSSGTSLFHLLNQSIETAYQSTLNSFTNSQANFAETDASATNAQNQSQIAVDQARANMELSQQALRDGETTATLNLNIAEDTAQITYTQGYNTLDDVIRYLGGSSLSRYRFKNILSSDQDALLTAENQFILAKNSFVGLASTNSSNPDADLATLKSVFGQLKQLNNDTVTLLNFAVTGNNFTASDISAAKTQAATFRTSLNALELSIANNQNNLENTREQKRISVDSLKKKVEIAKLQLRNAESALASQKNASAIQKISASSSLNTAQSSLATARRNFQNLRVPAPFSGTVISHKVSVGSQVNPGQEILEVGDLDIIEIKLNLANTFSEGLILGQTVKINSEPLGRISEIEPAADLNTGKIGLTIEADNLDGRFVPGSVADVEFDLVFKTGGVIVVPLRIVKISQAAQTVLVVRENAIVEQPVQLGQVFNDFVEVTQGLQDGDRIVVKNGGFLQEGDEVKINN